ncbi:hypothetical protein JSR02_00595 [Candidatus Vidania fulgoroideae]|uniref:Uncharacterized protein n=1 Tax=Candidatus Vidania fulgoroideorum TaxID=881286 RepID=A0A974X728_9PROT|nr:hypothetical protein JSR02_00595 [Candidatus Vidania fulgoroideae]
MVFRFTKLLGQQLLRFATCFSNHKQKEIYLRFLPAYVVFAYSDSYINVIYYNIFATALSYCVAIDYRFLVKVFTNLYDFDIYFDFSKRQLVLKTSTVVFTTCKFLYSNYSYSLRVFATGFVTYIESVLLLNPVFLFSSLGTLSNTYYVFTVGVVSYLSFDDFRILLVRKPSFLISFNYCFAFSCNVLRILRRVLGRFAITSNLYLCFNNNVIQINGIKLFITTYIATDLDFNYVMVLTVTSDYYYVSVNAVEFFKALSFIKNLHGDVNCDYYVVIMNGVLMVEYYSSFGDKLISTIGIVDCGLNLRLCLNLGFCIDFFMLFPYAVFVLAILNSYSKVFMLSSDLYSYIYCVMPVLT